MDGDRDLRKRLHRIATLVKELDEISDPKCRSAAKELIQTVMDVHSTALERILDVVFQAGDVGQHVIDDLGADPIVAGLLVLYGLHPEPFEVRVQKAMQQISPSLQSHGATAELVSVHNEDVRVQVNTGAHTCGSTAATLKSMLEDAFYEAAPELTSLTIDGLDGKQASGFVPLSTLAGVSAAKSLAVPPQAVPETRCESL